MTMAVRNLLKRKLRTFLTILGVVIGTAAIVVMISLALAMNDTFNEELKKLGDITVVTVYSPDMYGGGPVAGEGGAGFAVNSRSGGGGAGGAGLKLDGNAVVKFKALPGVVAATPIVETNFYAKSGRYVCDWIRVLGLDPEAMDALGYTAGEGRLLESADTYSIVYGAEVPLQFYKESSDWRSRQNTTGEPLVDVMSARIQYSYDWRLIYRDSGGTAVESAPEVKLYRMQTVGTLAKKEDYRIDYAVFVPLVTAEKIMADQRKFEQQQSQQWQGARAPGADRNATGYQTAYVKCRDLDTVKKVRDAILAMGFPAEIPSQQLESMQRVSQSLQGLLGAIGAVALFVAAIGIANTMIMAIYERTREIGIMKVIGAALGDIGKLFLLEAALIGFFGGVLGVGLSGIISYFLNSSGLSFMENEYMATQQASVSMLTPLLCAGGLGFATVIGLVSGYFPARRAMMISALTAIRTE
jgi:ABC-type lipoprotein release transport system permease subunit